MSALRSAFSPEHRRDLKRQLGPNASALIRRLDDAARLYKPLERESAKQAAARRKAAQETSDTVRRLERQIVRLREALQRTEAMFRDPAVSKILRRRLTLGSLPHLVENVIAECRRELEPELERSVERLETASESAARELVRKRGRKIGDRLKLAEWIATQLRSAGYHVTAKPAGLFGATLAIVYEAAGEKHIEDLHRDLRHAVRHLP